MNKYQLYTLGGALLAASSLSSCASNGSFASKTNPVDYTVTLNRVCTGIKGMDAIVQGAAAGGLIDAKGRSVEASAIALVSNFCDPTKPPTDVAGAVAAIAASMADMGDLIAAIDKPS